MANLFPKGDMGAGKQGGFLHDIGSNMDLKVETPNGCIYSSSDLGALAAGPSGPQQHQGAVSSESNLGNRGGRPGKKPAV